MLSAHPPVPLESIQFVQDSNGTGRRLSLTTATGHVLQTQRGVAGTPGTLSPLPGTPEDTSPEHTSSEHEHSEPGTPGGETTRSGQSTPDFGGFGQGTQLEEKDFEEHARGRSVSFGVYTGKGPHEREGDGFRAIGSHMDVVSLYSLLLPPSNRVRRD